MRAAVADGLEQLLDHEWRLRVAAPDVAAEDVHKARVAARRLRSNLKTLQAGLDPVWTRHVQGDLKWIGSALGAIRDTDVLAGHLATAPEELQAALSQDRADAVERLIPALTSERYLNLLDRLHAASRIPPTLPVGVVGGSGRRQLRKLLDADFRDVQRRVRKAGGHPSDRQLHRIRIAAKRLRYAAELAEPIVGASSRRTARAAEEVQTVLGEHHDAVAAEDWLRKQVEGRSGESNPSVSVASAFAAGCLVAEQRQRQQELRRTWVRSWKQLRRQVRASLR